MIRALPNNDLQRISENLWRPSSLKRDPEFVPVMGDRLGRLSALRAETEDEAHFLAQRRAGLDQTRNRDASDPSAPGDLPTSPSPKSIGSHASPPNWQASFLVPALLSELHDGQARLQQTLADRSAADFLPLAKSSQSELKRVNPLVYDRLQAVAPAQRQRVIAAGPLEDLTVLIPATYPSGPRGREKAESAKRGQPEWAELFRSTRHPAGETSIDGQRWMGGQWYQFHSQVATPPVRATSGTSGRPVRASLARTAMAPVSLLNNRAAELPPRADRAQVSRDVQDLAQQPWRAYWQGETMRGAPHCIQGIHTEKDKLEVFQAHYDSVLGVLELAQNVAGGILRVADFLGLGAALGQVGGWLGDFANLELPASPADFINSILLGSGGPLGGAGPTPVSSHSGSGVDGCVVTQCGAAANAAGEGLLDALGVGEGGAGEEPVAGSPSNKEVAAPDSSDAELTKQASDQANPESLEDAQAEADPPQTEDPDLEPSSTGKAEPEGTPPHPMDSDGSGIESIDPHDDPLGDNPAGQGGVELECEAPEPYKSEISKLREQISDPNTSEEERDQLFDRHAQLEREAYAGGCPDHQPPDTSSREATIEIPDEPDDSLKTRVGHKIEVGMDIDPKRGGPSGTVDGAMVLEKELYRSDGQVGPFSIESTTTHRSEIGVDQSGKYVRGELEHKVGIGNRLGDEIYCRGSGSSKQDGTDAKVGAACGIKAALDPDRKIGTEVGRSTDRKIGVDVTPRECLTDLATGDQTCTRKLEVKTPVTTISVSYESTTRGVPPGLGGTNQ